MELVLDLKAELMAVGQEGPSFARSNKLRNGLRKRVQRDRGEPGRFGPFGPVFEGEVVRSEYDPPGSKPRLAGARIFGRTKRHNRYRRHYFSPCSPWHPLL